MEQRKSKTRAQQRAAGTKKTALFDIVNRNNAATHSVPAERVPRRAVTATSRVPAKRAHQSPIFARGVGTRARARTQGRHDVRKPAATGVVSDARS
jgi:hypothetical protein